MSVRKRWILGAVTVALGAGWMWCTAGHHDDTRMHAVADGLRTLFIVASLALVMCCLVTPMSAALHIGRQIGRAEQRRDCGCRVDAPRPSSRVVEFKPPRRN
jgi:hypothetical protein